MIMYVWVRAYMHLNFIVVVTVPADILVQLHTSKYCFLQISPNLLHISISHCFLSMIFIQLQQNQIW